MPYRNKEWYIPIIKTMSAEKAYEYVSENLKAPSFVYEPENAVAAYREVFGVEYASPQERAMKTAADKIRELEAENERLKAIVQPVATEEMPMEADPVDVAPVSEVVAAAVDEKMTQEQFATAHPEITVGLKMFRAYKKYLKE
jgi:hypothetical protein